MDFLGLELARANNLNERKLDDTIRNTLHRRSIRNLTLILALLVQLFMAGLLFIVFTAIYSNPDKWEPQFQIVIFLAPITSITVITLTLLVGTSRVAKENSTGNFADGILQLFNNFKSLSNKD